LFTECLAGLHAAHLGFVAAGTSPGLTAAKRITAGKAVESWLKNAANVVAIELRGRVFTGQVTTV